ncbi:MAG: DUF2905 domain-containing protein [Bacteroidota bacterium]|nr:DUF2905 domain-containing protein [Bacteroidota bacterium]
MHQTGKLIIIIGVVIVAIGIFVWLFGKHFTWFGNLPGDVKMERENFRFYAPIASMLIISVAISVILWLVNRFWK